MESEIVYISDAEFANSLQVLPDLASFRGKTIVNKYQILAKAVIASKYEDTELDFENCSAEEKQKLRNDYNRIEKKIRTNSKNKKPFSFGLDGNRPFMSSELYPTLIVSTAYPSKNER